MFLSRKHLDPVGAGPGGLAVAALAQARRLDRLSRAFGPTMRRIAHKLTVDPETGRIDENLARVLRRVVFLKDSRWVELVAAE